MVNDLVEIAGQLGDALIGPRAVVPWWGLVAWLVVIFGGVLMPAFLPDRDAERRAQLENARLEKSRR